MRGVISAGMVSALESFGLTDAFDAVYGSSAGDQRRIFSRARRHLARASTTRTSTTRASSTSRAPAARQIVDLGYLLDDVAVHRKPLDIARVIASASPLSVMATDVDSRQPVALRNFASARDLIAALRAGATMPVVAGPPRRIGDRRYLDASLSEPIPVPVAEADGCTHVLVLLTRGAKMRSRPSAFDRYFVAPRLRRVSAPLAARYLDRAKPYAALMEAIDLGTGPLGRAHVFAIRVRDLTIGKLERRGETLARRRSGLPRGVRGFSKNVRCDGRRNRTFRTVSHLHPLHCPHLSHPRVVFPIPRRISVGIGNAIFRPLSHKRCRASVIRHW